VCTTQAVFHAGRIALPNPKGGGLLNMLKVIYQTSSNNQPPSAEESRLVTVQDITVGGDTDVS
jgi:hypothetical protein